MTNEQVRVKKLQWRDSYGVLRAETPFGDYMVTGKILRFPNRAESVHENRDTAKDVAQFHFERRVRECLECPTDAKP